MGLIRGSYNIVAALVGLFILPLGYLMIGKPMRGIMVSLAMILIALFTAGIGLIIAYPIALIDIATGGEMG